MSEERYWVGKDEIDLEVEAKDDMVMKDICRQILHKQQVQILYSAGT